MDDNSKEFYTNAVNVIGSVFDVTLIFRSQSPQIDANGKIIDLNGSHSQPVLNISNEMIVRMSPQHAKALATLLVQQVVQYENSFKLTLPLTPELERIWTEQLKGK
ncbi:MAG: hypothetical protein A2X25_06800 [Chloroflexi bacterium GWB2_49_20]|nr:MAG: hypothetical protein A2X25_06800 [Chloroflexi bacterium GWB2_49_20]OGN80252.1 MAG: hypothetical protein A2X26_07975 [Chloroflexi bacterium GWC2_49_37]OGN86107.1 MAG: hypothetical protein A2X27_00765 [Chloroflexi bacterium GWD2_49_16]HCC79412.1 hypothetical protein [Anaerolineae bacterium]HCM96367.1 hypothetical protein [Anaerolineae bacterium]